MKKLINALLVVAMVASTMVTSAFAATNKFTVSVDGDGPFKAGDEITVFVDLDMQVPMAGFNADMTFDKDAFSAVSAAATRRTDWMGSVTGGLPAVANETGKFTVQYVSADNDEVFDDAFYQLTYKFTVKDTAASGNYTFDFIVNDMVDQTAAKVTCDDSVADTVAVEGITVEEKTEATLATEEKASEAVDNYYTQGFKAVVTPNDQIVSEVKVVLTATKAAKTAEPIVWTAPVEGFASYSFAVNVLNVPDGETVTAAWDMTAAFAE